MEYKEDFISLSRENLISRLKENLSPWRYEHVLRVEATAIDLAEHYGANQEAASVAALMHDYAKEMDQDSMRDLAIQYTGDQDLADYSGAIWHGPAAAQIAREEFACHHQDILDAIAQHTIGAKEMSLLAKIIFVADYIEPGRDFKGVELARRKAYKSLDEAVFLKIQGSLLKTIRDGQTVYVKSIENYNAFREKV